MGFWDKRFQRVLNTPNVHVPPWLWHDSWCTESDYPPLMNERLNTMDMPEFQQHHAVETAEPSAPPPTPPIPGRLKRAIRACTIVVLIGLVGAGALLWVLLNHSISNEQLRAEVESQLTAALGEDHHASIGETSVAIGQGGLLAIDAQDVKILKDGVVNLGIARQIAVKLDPVPLLTGTVVAQSVTMRGASVAVGSLVGNSLATDSKPAWPQSVQLKSGLRAIGEFFGTVAKSVSDAGLESLALEDANLVGFDQLGLRSSTARLSVLIAKQRDEGGIEFDATMTTEFNTWQLHGVWHENNQGTAAKTLTLVASGLGISDVLGALVDPSIAAGFSNSLSIIAEIPFTADGTPLESQMAVKVGRGQIQFEPGHVAQMQAAELNLRLLPDKNQIDLVRSNLRFDRTTAVLTGGLRYPESPDDPISQQPVFRLIAEEFDAFGLDTGTPGPKGKFLLEGVLDTKNQVIEMDRMVLNTPKGRVEGQATVLMTTGKPHLKLNLAVPAIPVDEFKQFWPSIFATKARTWVDENVSGGDIKDAWVKLDFPPGLMGQDINYKPENITAAIPISNTVIKSPDELPAIAQADGIVEVLGNHTNVWISKGRADLGSYGGIDIGKSSMQMGNYAVPITPAELNLELSGPASAMVRLAALEPLSYEGKNRLDAGSLKGGATAKIKAHFNINKGVTLDSKPWSATIKTRKVSSKKPVEGRKLTNANLTIVASPTVAKINGTAQLDGLPVRLAMVEKLGENSGSNSQISLILSDKDRKRLGIDTGNIITGPVTAKISSQPDGSQAIEADLKNTKLDFPWIGWSKGKGIPAKATFIVRKKGELTSLSKLKLRGAGFSANGALIFDRAGLRKADISKVVLNKIDDFDLNVTRNRKGYNILLKARAYDGRALVRSFMAASPKESIPGPTISVKGRVGRLIGFGGQSLSNVDIDYLQSGNRVSRVFVQATAANNAPTIFMLGPVPGGTKTEMRTTNAGSVLQFLDLYTKVRGGKIEADLVRDDSQVFRGKVKATNIELLGEPRLAQLLQKPQSTPAITNGDEVVRQLRRIKTDKAKIDQLTAKIEKGVGYLNIGEGRLSGGDASAAFDGSVYDRRNRMNLSGTYLPGRSLNRLVSQIPLLGLALGKGRVNGLLGITFKLKGRYENPTLQVNPLSIIAPGVFRQIFKF